jgi:cellulose synthase/poly-beta-1,6-N-acetylglucosamine synthase-like glycosyltransferase
MVRRAIACFRAQRYERKRLLIWDTGYNPALELDQITSDLWYDRPWRNLGGTIGTLRNAANSLALSDTFSPDGSRVDLIAHFDSDDVSHPRRLEEQVALLEASGKMCVGYRECLFWDTRVKHASLGGTDVTSHVDEAWLYCQRDPRFAIGASMLYRRELWEQQPFPDVPHEDYRWWLTPLVSNNCVGVSSILGDFDPRMVCQIHGGNTETYDRATMLAGGGGMWSRAAASDTHCAEVMKLCA